MAVRLAAFVTNNFSHLSLFKHLVSANVQTKTYLRVLYARLRCPSNLTFMKTERYATVAAVHASNAYGGIELQFHWFFTLH
jgi:hypothetical protein